MEVIVGILVGVILTLTIQSLIKKISNSSSSSQVVEDKGGSAPSKTPNKQ